MCLEERIRLCRLLDKMETQKSYSRKLGLEDTSSFHGKQIKKSTNVLKERGWD